MSLRFYFDVHSPRPIARELRRLGIDVLTAQEDHGARWSDARLLDRAGELQRLLFTSDEDFLIEAAKRQRNRESFAGIIYAHLLYVPTGVCVADLEIISKYGEHADFRGRVTHLPLRAGQ